jgi:hypothetical protein
MRELDRARPETSIIALLIGAFAGDMWLAVAFRFASDALDHSSDDCDNAPAYTAFAHLLIRRGIACGGGISSVFSEAWRWRGLVA